MLVNRVSLDGDELEPVLKLNDSVNNAIALDFDYRCVRGLCACVCVCVCVYVCVYVYVCMVFTLRASHYIHVMRE